MSHLHLSVLICRRFCNLNYFVHRETFCFSFARIGGDYIIFIGLSRCYIFHVDLSAVFLSDQVSKLSDCISMLLRTVSASECLFIGKLYDDIDRVSALLTFLCQIVCSYVLNSLTT